MSKKSTTEQLRELRTETGTVAMLARMIAAELMRSSLERMRVREHARRRRAAERRRRALGFGAAALVLASAAVAARRAYAPGDSWEPEPATKPAEPPVATPAA